MSVPAIPKSDDGGESAARILVVDDDGQVRRIIAVRLQLEGHVVVQADEGRDALDKLDASRFDVVIADINMPRMDGRDLLLIMAARHPTLPIILITGEVARLEDEPALQLAFAIFTKPFEPTLLIQAVNRALGR